MIYKSEVCRGSLGCGAPCGQCERCNELAAGLLEEAIALVNASGTHVVVPVGKKVTTREKGPVEILCKEIGTHFRRDMENPILFVAFVRVLVSNIAEMYETQDTLAPYTNRPPTDVSRDLLRDVRHMISLDAPADTLIDRAAGLHSKMEECGVSEMDPADHISDMLNSCVSAIRFGLETPCKSRHAAEAAQHVWKQRYGISLFDEFTSDWRREWSRAQMQKALLSLAAPAMLSASLTQSEGGK